MFVVPAEKIWRHQVLQRHRDPKFQIAWIRQVIILFGARGDSVVILGLLAAIEREIPNLDVDGSGGEPHETESGTLVRPMSRPTRDSDTLVRPISRSSQNNQPPPRPMQPKVMNQSNIGQGEPTPPPRDHRKPTVSPPAPPMPVQPANQITPDVPARPSRPRTNSQSDNSQKQRPPKPPPPNPGTYQSKINSKGCLIKQFLARQIKPNGVIPTPKVPMGAGLSKIFNGCPLNINCATSWIHPETNDQHILFGCDEGMCSTLSWSIDL